MEKKVLREVKHLCSIFTKEHFKGFVKATWVYGSSTKKKSANDIDILLLIDDTIESYQEKAARLLSVISIITKHSHLNLHFQKPIPLSLLWTLVIKGEPWIITAIKNSIVIHDPYNYVVLLKKLIRNKGDMSRDIKAERLVSRAEDSLTDNRGLMMGFIEELFFACLEAAQIYLLLKDKTIYKPRKTIKELKKMEIDTDDFFEILNLNEKANKGSLSEFSGEDLDYYLKQTNRFILKLKKLSLEEVNQR